MTDRVLVVTSHKHEERGFSMEVYSSDDKQSYFYTWTWNEVAARMAPLLKSPFKEPGGRITWK